MGVDSGYTLEILNLSKVFENLRYMGISTGGRINDSVTKSSTQAI
jgi:hypothetical protein